MICDHPPFYQRRRSGRFEIFVFRTNSKIRISGRTLVRPLFVRVRPFFSSGGLAGALPAAPDTAQEGSNGGDDTRASYTLGGPGPDNFFFSHNKPFYTITING